MDHTVDGNTRLVRRCFASSAQLGESCELGRHNSAFLYFAVLHESSRAHTSSSPTRYYTRSNSHRQSSITLSLKLTLTVLTLLMVRENDSWR